MAYVVLDARRVVTYLQRVVDLTAFGNFAAAVSVTAFGSTSGEELAPHRIVSLIAHSLGACAGICECVPGEILQPPHCWILTKTTSAI
jgi:hypothetical protein